MVVEAVAIQRKRRTGGAGREKEAGQIKDVDILALGHTRDPDPLHIAVGTGAEAGEVTIVAMTEVEVQVVVAIVEVGIVLQEEAENDPREEEVESVTLEEVEIVRREEVIVVAGRTPHHLLIQVRRLHHGLPRRDGGVGHHNDTGPPRRRNIKTTQSTLHLSHFLRKFLPMMKIFQK